GKVFYYLFDYSNNNVINEKVNVKNTKEIKSKNSFNSNEIFNNKSSKLEGKTFVVSGVFENISREDLKLLIENNGGKVGSSISAKTDFVVAGENMGPSKRTKADELKIPIISENDFFKMIQ
ncbi:MAG: BRCT domain-containing protein, partial [Flavobacteriaceae bacterium]|nr:BRCT domain-containing protein [Flavobacteriaceae bacterium]